MKKEYRSISKTKNKIRVAFSDLLQEKKSIQKITVNEITKKADIAKSTFYNHYNDIYSVVEEFEDELIQQISNALNEIANLKTTKIDEYIRKVIGFLKINEQIYRKAILSSDVPFFIEKLKVIISKKIFESNEALPFSINKAEKYAQIRFLTNACVDTVADYFKGNIRLSLEELGNLIIDLLNNLMYK